MGEMIMQLKEVFQKIDSFSEDETIYSKTPWKLESASVVALEPDDGNLPLDALRVDAKYFLEVFLAKQILEDLSLDRHKFPTEEDRFMRLIEFAINDA